MAESSKVRLLVDMVMDQLPTLLNAWTANNDSLFQQLLTLKIYNIPITMMFILIGASVSEAPLVDSTDALSR